MILTQSAIKKFLKCRRLYWFRYCAEIVPNQQKTNALLLGSAVHKALELWYDGNTSDDSIDNAGFDKLDPHDRTLGLAMVNGYFYRYHDEPFTTTAQETRFDHELHPGVTLSGKIDAHILRQGKEHCLMEHKTATSVNQNYIQKLDTDFQCLFYLCFGGTESQTILYNILEKASLRQKKSEARTEFEQRLKDEYLTNTARYMRFWLHFTYEDQRNFRKEILEIVHQITECYRRDVWHRNREACFPWMGRPCEYRELCYDITNPTIQNKFHVEPAHQELEED